MARAVPKNRVTAECGQHDAPMCARAGRSSAPWATWRRLSGTLLALAAAAGAWGAAPEPQTPVAETPPAQQEPAAMSTSVADNFAQRELQAVQEMLALATAEFDGPQQSRSIVRFDEIISRLEGLRRQGTLPPRGREILVQAYELRGRAYYNIGLQEKAADSFTLLVQIQPQYSLSKEKVSPKIVDYFNSVKKALVGYLAVTSQPAGAKVVLTGVGETRDLGLTDFFPLEVLAGDYTVEISREGYRSESRALSIAPRATETVAVDLVRVSASCFFITEPAGVEVWVDGELKTATAG
jgi:hypothetical protein